MKLGDYANIRTGLVLSRKIASSKVQAHQYIALTLKAQTADGTIDHNSTEKYFATELLKQDYFTRVGDVLLRLSAPYTATCITDENKNLLVSAHFTIIRVEGDEIDPAYLKWWLTQNRKRFYQAASGVAIMGTISSGYVAEMKFSPPPIQQQRQAGQLLLLAQREQQLLDKLTDKKKILINALLVTKFEEDKI